MPDHLVRRRRAVGDEKAVIGVEDARGVALRGGDGPRMIEELPQLVDRIADVGAQHVLAEELVEHLADGTLEERYAAGVTRAMPRVRAVRQGQLEHAEGLADAHGAVGREECVDGIEAFASRAHDDLTDPVHGIGDARG